MQIGLSYLLSSVFQHAPFSGHGRMQNRKFISVLSSWKRPPSPRNGYVGGSRWKAIIFHLAFVWAENWPIEIRVFRKLVRCVIATVFLNCRVLELFLLLYLDGQHLLAWLHSQAVAEDKRQTITFLISNPAFANPYVKLLISQQLITAFLLVFLLESKTNGLESCESLLRTLPIIRQSNKAIHNILSSQPWPAIPGVTYPLLVPISPRRESAEDDIVIGRPGIWCYRNRSQLTPAITTYWCQFEVVIKLLSLL